MDFEKISHWCGKIVSKYNNSFDCQRSSGQSLWGEPDFASKYTQKSSGSAKGDFRSHKSSTVTSGPTWHDPYSAPSTPTSASLNDARCNKIKRFRQGKNFEILPLLTPATRGNRRCVNKDVGTESFSLQATEHPPQALPPRHDPPQQPEPRESPRGRG